MPNISELKGKHSGQTAWIVGRGPSLTVLSKEDIGEGFVISLNQAIGTIDELEVQNMVYAMYKDGCQEPDKDRKHTCISEYVKPKKAPILVQDLPIDGVNCFLDYSPRYTFQNEKDFNVPNTIASAASSIWMAKYLGASQIKMLCFDAYTDLDLRAYNPGGAYHKTDAAYLGQRQQIEYSVKNCGIPVEWVRTKKQHEIKDQDSGVVIATPMFDGRCEHEYALSLAITCAALMKLNITYDVWPLVNSCYVDDARNHLFTSFLDSPFKKLFFIDSDMGWQIKDFWKIMESDKDVIGAAYPMKNKWKEFTGTLTKDENGKYIKEGNLYQANAVATGFMAISKKAAKDIVKSYPDFYVHNRAIYNVFGFIYKDGLRYGDDVSFCMRYSSIGKMWCDPDIELSHIGRTRNVGRIKEKINEEEVDNLKLKQGNISDISQMEKFDLVWEKGDYRGGSTGERLAKKFCSKIGNANTVNSYGTGTGREIVEILKEKNVSVTMTDISLKAMEPCCKKLLGEKNKFIHADLADLPDDFPKAKWGICTNVLMVIQEEKIDKCLQNIKRTCENLFLEVYDYNDKRCGIEMTVCKHNQKWWENKLIQYWGCVIKEKYDNESRRYIFTCYPSVPNTLNDYFDKNGSDKGTSGHCYGNYYEKYISHLKNNNVKILEIGLSCNGTSQVPSLSAWKEYFPKSEIVGFDIRDFKKMEDERIKIYCGDQSVSSDIEKPMKHGPFDIIIDDGSHESCDQIPTFEVAYPHLKNDGIYVIEDLIYDRNYKLMEYLKKRKIPNMKMYDSADRGVTILFIGGKNV